MNLLEIPILFSLSLHVRTFVRFPRMLVIFVKQQIVVMPLSQVEFDAQLPGLNPTPCSMAGINTKHIPSAMQPFISPIVYEYFTDKKSDLTAKTC